MSDLNADIIIIGSGAGGGTMAYALKDSGAHVLILERGDSYRSKARTGRPSTRSPARDTSQTSGGSTGGATIGAQPLLVGGITKMFGACSRGCDLPTLRSTGLTRSISGVANRL